jgi:hypothetical protein
MRAAPIGAEVGLYVDLRERVELGDVIETRAGRRYGVTSVRVQERGKHAGRQHLRAVVLAEGEQLMISRDVGDRTVVTSGGRTHRIRWYRRDRASAGVLPKGRR